MQFENKFATLNARLEIEKNILNEAYDVTKCYINLVRKIFIRLLILLNSSTLSNNSEMSKMLLLHFRTINKAFDSVNTLKTCICNYTNICKNIHIAKIQLIYNYCNASNF